jgi:hypothetical protein
MKTDFQPFLLRYAVRLPTEPSVPFQYDSDRQIGRVLVHGQWQDVTCLRLDSLFGSTRKTALKPETTDDR